MVELSLTALRLREVLKCLVVVEAAIVSSTLGFVVFFEILLEERSVRRAEGKVAGPVMWRLRTWVLLTARETALEAAIVLAKNLVGLGDGTLR